MPHARELDWLQHSAGVVALEDRTIITLRGDDTIEWLQGQITNDVKGLAEDNSVYAFVLTLKGRVMADVWALLQQDEVWLDVPAAGVEALVQRLDRYIMMEDVELEHRPDLRVIAAQGPRAADLSEGGWRADRLGLGGRQWVVPVASFGAELDRLTDCSRALGGGPISDRAWREAHVVFGRPRFGIDFGEWTYPQETGLHRIAVSFNKGCYTGQETVVMLENRGKAPKVLWRWVIDGVEPPEPATPIVVDGQRVGEITSAVQGEDGVLGLGFLKRGHDIDRREGFQIGHLSAHAVGPVEIGPAARRIER